MNELGLVLVWCAIQVTVLCGISGLLYSLVRRIGPSAASLAALTGLFLVVVLSAFAFSPWPRWAVPRSQNDSTARTSAVTGPVADDGARAEATIASNSDRVSRGPTAPSTAASFFVALWDELLRPTASTAHTHSGWRWHASFALIFLIGVAVGLARLITGLACIRGYRRECRPVCDTGLLELVEGIRKELQCRRPVELCQSDSLTTAATVGWRRPLILLPGGWVQWSKPERRAVLAHEIAHIQRNDFLAWVCAQVGLVLHFYHPLVHWLAGRLRLEQELAADAAAARFVGGQQPYLTTLAEMALRQADRPLSWPARTFLPTRRTFLRRIEMLRDSRNLIRATSGSRRLAIVAVLFVAALAAAGFRGTASTPSNEAVAGQSPATNEQLKEARAHKVAVEAAEGRLQGKGSLSLAYVPRDAFIVGAVRPAKLLSYPSLRPLAAELQQDRDFKKQIGVTVNRIEEVTFFLLMQDALSGSPRVGLQGTVTRTKTGEDARRIGNMYAPDAVKESYAGQEYYKCESTRPRFYYLPEDRTVVTSNDVGLLRRIIVAGKPGASQADWAKTWQQMAHNDAAVLYNLRGLKTLIDAETARAPERVRLQLVPFAPLWQSVTTAAAGLTFDKQLTLEGIADCDTAEDGKRVRDTLSAVMTLAKNALSQLREAASAQPEPEGPIILRSADVAGALLEKLTIAQDDKRILLDARASGEETAKVVADMLPAVKAARAAARRAQSMNNLKQLTLAFHNYHDTHKRFPPATIMGPDGKTPHSWRVAVLPFVDQANLYDQYRLTEPWDSPHNKKLLERIPAVFRNPKADPDSTNSSYFALTGNGTAFSMKEGTRMRDMRDGTSNTILLVEAKREIPWTKPEDIPYDPSKKIPELGGFQEGIFLTAFCDGSVHAIAQTINEETLRRLITMADGQRVGEY